MYVIRVVGCISNFISQLRHKRTELGSLVFYFLFLPLAKGITLFT